MRGRSLKRASNSMHGPRALSFLLTVLSLLAFARNPALGQNQNWPIEETIPAEKWPGIGNATADEVRKWQMSGKRLVIVDLRRSTIDFANGHIPGARHLDYRLLDRRHMSPGELGISRDSNIVVYTDHPEAGFILGPAGDFRAAGYKHIWLMSDGIEDWKAKGYPLQTRRDVIRAMVSQSTSWAAKNQSAVIIDLGNEYAFSNEHIAGSRNIPLSQLESKIGRLPSNSTIFVYDRDPNRVQAGLGILKAHNIKASEVPGGFEGWKVSKLPLARNPPPPRWKLLLLWYSPELLTLLVVAVTLMVASFCTSRVKAFFTLLPFFALAAAALVWFLIPKQTLSGLLFIYALAHMH